MAPPNVHALLSTLLSLIALLVECAPQQPPSPPGRFGGPFPAGNSTILSPTGSALFPTASGTSNQNASMCQVVPLGLGPVDGGPPNPDVYSTACSCNQLVSAHAATLTSTFQNRVGPVTETLTTFTDTSYQPPDNCCIKCWISAADVQVIYWPVETNAPDGKNGTMTTIKWNATSTLPPNPTITAAPTPYSLVQDGFTFVSPSVYVAYHNLQAYAVCPSFGDTYPRGKTYNTTIAYAPNDLSTSICTTGSQGIQPIGYGHFAAINYTEYQFSTSAWSQCAKEIEAGTGGSASVEGPFYSIPNDVSLIDPAWHTCSAVFNGVFDPPRLLNPAPALVTGGGAGGASAPAALNPAPALVPPTPTPTPTPPPSIPASSGPIANNPPANNPPANNPPANNPPANNPPANNPPSNNPPLNNPPTNNPPANNPPANNPPANNPPTNNPPTNNPPTGNPPANNPPTNNPPANNQPANNPPGNNQAPNADGSPTILVLPQPVGAAPTPAPTPAPVIMNSPSQPPPITANGVTISRAPAGVSPNNGVGASGNGIGSPNNVGGSPGNPGGNAGSGGNNANGAGGNNANGAGGINPNGAGGVVISGTTYSNGASTVLPGGQPLSVASDSVLLGGSSYALAPAASPTPLIIAGNSISRASNGGLIIGSSTIAPGAPPTTAYGHAISVGQSSAVIDGSTYALPSPPSTPPTTAITLSNGAVISAGGAPVTVSGTTVALASNGASLVINGNTFSIPPASPSAGGGGGGALPSSSAVLTVGGQTFFASSAGFAVGSQTVVPGGSAITVSGTVISLGPSGKLVIGSQTTSLPPGGSGVAETVGGVAIQAPTATGVAGSTGRPVQAFTGAAVRSRLGSLRLVVFGTVGVALMLF